ncbi:hypothetical protein ACJX0J_009520, partial [Zea mays]
LSQTYPFSLEFHMSYMKQNVLYMFLQFINTLDHHHNIIKLRITSYILRQTLAAGSPAEILSLGIFQGQNVVIWHNTSKILKLREPIFYARFDLLFAYAQAVSIGLISILNF